MDERIDVCEDIAIDLPASFGHVQSLVAESESEEWC